MILFENDWHEQGAIPHMESTNLTFHRTALQLKKMGIRNNKFMLAIHDKEIAKYDPHRLADPSIELRLRIANETKRNVWYFLREVIRVPAGSVGTIPYVANRSNVAMTWHVMNNIDYFSTQSRQTGKTVGILSLDAYFIYIYCTDTDIVMYGHTTDLLQKNVSRIKAIRDALPSYILKESSKDTDNKEGIFYKRLNNHYMTICAQSSIQLADQKGRGQSVPLVRPDEFAYAVNNGITISAMKGSMSDAIVKAKDNHKPYGIVYTTTAGNLDTASGREAYKVVQKAMPISEKIYDCKDYDEAMALVKKNSLNLTVYAEFSYLQLNKTHEWFVEEIQRHGGTEEQIDLDYRNKWRRYSSDSSLLDKKVIDVLNNNKSEPTFTRISGDYVMYWYIPEYVVDGPGFTDTHYILGMDGAANVGKDFTALVLTDIRDMSVAATFRCNETNTLSLGMFIAEFLIRHTNVTWIPERNFTGSAIIDNVIFFFRKAGINPFNRIFNTVIQGRDTSPELRQVDIYAPDIYEDMKRKYLGFSTTGQSRPYLYTHTFNRAMGMNTTRIRDITLIQELISLTSRNGRIDHTSGNHDDMVIAYLLTCYFIFYGKDFRHYGIDPNLVLSNIDLAGNKTNATYKNQQLEIRKKIKHLEALAAAAFSPALKQTYIQKINELSQDIDDTLVVTPLSLEKTKADLETYGNIYSSKVDKPNRPKANAFNNVIRLLGGDPHNVP